MEGPSHRRTPAAVANVNARGKRKPSRGDITHAEILRVALRLFSVHGYHSTSIADVFEAIGLSKGAFYHHYRTKEDLALAVLDHVQEEYGRRLFGPAMGMPTAGSRLREMLARAVALNRRGEWCNCRLLMTLAAELTETDGVLHQRVIRMQSESFAIWRELVAGAQASGEARANVAPETCAQWILFTLAGFVLTKKLGCEQVPGEQVFETMLTWLTTAT